MFTTAVRIAAVALFSITLTGCSGMMEAIEQSNERDRQRAQEQNDANWRSVERTCSSFGFQKGTDAFANCMQREVVKFDNARNAAAQAEQKYWADLSCRAGNVQHCENYRATDCVRTGNGGISCVTR